MVVIVHGNKEPKKEIGGFVKSFIFIKEYLAWGVNLRLKEFMQKWQHMNICLDSVLDV